MVIGALSGKSGMNSVEGFFVTPFQGVLALFLLEMGMVAGRRLGDLKKVGVFLLLFGCRVKNGRLRREVGCREKEKPVNAAKHGVMPSSLGREYPDQKRWRR